MDFVVFRGLLIGIFQNGGVISCIENRFEDFLSKENLEKVPDSKAFQDLKYGFVFNHEITHSLEADYEYIRDKYNRRIALFLEKIKERTCFIRAVRHPKEIEYIAQNCDYINFLIKRDNPENEIIYLVLDHFRLPVALQDAHNIYQLNIHKYNGERKELDKLFDQSPLFLQWCREHSEEQMRKRNLIFSSSLD